MMHDAPLAVPYVEGGYSNPPRSWQVIATGTMLGSLSSGLVEDLGRLLDLRPDIGSLVLKTDDGEVLVARDWPSDRMEEADDTLARIEAAPGICAVTLQGG